MRGTWAVSFVESQRCRAGGREFFPENKIIYFLPLYEKRDSHMENMLKLFRVFMEACIDRVRGGMLCDLSGE